MNLSRVCSLLVRPFIRAWRWVFQDCIVCGSFISVHENVHYRYCSLECAAYDGALKEPKKSWVLFGTLKKPKRHFEADMKGGE